MSMTVYLVEADGAFGNVLIPDDAAREAIREGEGYHLSASWTPPRGEPNDEDCNFVPTDCVCSYSSRRMLLNRRARSALGELLSSCGEFLPVLLGGYDYAWFNCWTEIDAADWERCEGEGRRRDGSFRRIRRYAFVLDRLVNAPAMFRINNGNLELFCTDVLRNAVERHDLTGFEFEPIWSSDTGGIRRPFIGLEDAVGEAARLRAERDERARRDMLDRMAADGGIAASFLQDR